MSRLVFLFVLAVFGPSLPVLAAQSAAPAQPPPALDFVLIGRDGKVENLGPAPRGAYSPRVSPDGRQLVVDAAEGVWIANLDSVSAARLLVPGRATWPFWAPDGRSVVYTAESEGQQALFRKSLDETPASLLLRPARAVESWSSRHDVLTYIELAAAGDYGIGAYSLKDQQRRLLINAVPSAQNSSQFSPDGTMIAYASNESGRFEIYVKRYPEGRAVQVTTAGGHHPVWSVDGKELLFDRDDKEFFVVSLDASTLQAGQPRLLPITGFVQTPLRRQFDLAPDGRLLMLVPRQSGY